MADGTYRFQQPTAGQFFFPHGAQQTHHQRHLPRNGSPVHAGRVGFSNDTPSPTRSPGAQSPAHNLYAMFSQSHQQGQHLMNGGPSQQRFAMQMNLAQKFQHQNHHAHHQTQHHHQPQQDHTAHSTHAGNLAHQHAFSGTLSTATPHFSSTHLPNGTPTSGTAALTKPLSEHWAHQLQMAAESRQASSPHHYARTNAHINKGITTTATNGVRKEGDNEERNRATGEDNKKRQRWMSLDFGGQGLRALSEPLFNYTFLDKLYLNFNKLTHLPAAIGRLRHLTHLDLSNNQLSELPAEIGMLSSLKNLLLFDNNLHSLPYELGYLYQLEFLGIEGNPLEDSLKDQLVQNGTKALVTHLRESAPVSLPPQQRDWIVLDDTPPPATGPPQEKLTVLSYNTLCDRYATHTQFGYTPSLALSWEYRKDLILQEIREPDADILCLQEVDMDNYNEFFRPQLAYNDYRGVFWPKSRARTMAEKEAKLVDGCATFFKSSKYLLLDKQIIDIANTAINRPDMKGEHDIFNRVMPRDNIAVVVFLENRATGTRFIVVNAHMHWDPAYNDVKLVQVAILLEQVAKLSEKYAKWPPVIDKAAFKLSDDSEEGKQSEPEPPQELAPSAQYSTGVQIPLIVSGDYNSTTDSGAYDLLAHGQLSKSHPDLANRGYGNFTREGMAHPFNLKSSYSNVGELSFTNYTPGFTEVVDYIWYSTNALQVTGLLGEVDKEYLRKVPGFPNYHFPSDHLALLSEFMVKERREKKAVTADFGPQRERRT
ncbi:glucose-repressible alcohol dehydrogenase transcriptional effector [Xylona heveae TC161]|uniref:CCR4-Not complex 3'-5'-exoribonuclease subunit Ccr4 n=1 Tax=Xylona heveae (strain CBS 132557 / TC161) TaxID=1328760 RepID=A0A165IKI6_XYLHT|nr:glucose-repressible alcohol dehydrogenase transcriptional effector [Xylona heveae TC161]KZF25029.1 glucose-repressible alcohol dehydrogenase transcriptional effector [Xylona heveae TC161]